MKSLLVELNADPDEGGLQSIIFLSLSETVPFGLKAAGGGDELNSDCSITCSFGVEFSLPVGVTDVGDELAVFIDKSPTL